MLSFEPLFKSDISLKLLFVAFGSMSELESNIWDRIFGGCCTKGPILNDNISL